MKTLLDLFKESIYSYVSITISIIVAILLLNIWRNKFSFKFVCTDYSTSGANISNVIYFFVTVILTDLVYQLSRTGWPLSQGSSLSPPLQWRVTMYITMSSIFTRILGFT